MPRAARRRGPRSIPTRPPSRRTRRRPRRTARRRAAPSRPTMDDADPCVHLRLTFRRADDGECRDDDLQRPADLLQVRLIDVEADVQAILAAWRVARLALDAHVAPAVTGERQRDLLLHR